MAIRFIRYFSASVFFRDIGGTDYGTQIQGLVELAASTPDLQIVQLGGVDTQKPLSDLIEEDAWLSAFESQRWVVDSPSEDCCDIWYAIPTVIDGRPVWHTIDILIRELAQKKRIPIFRTNAMLKPPLTAITAFEFAERVFTMLQDDLKSIPHYAASIVPPMTLSTISAIATQETLDQQWKDAQITLWHHDLWNAALSGYHVFQDHPISRQDVLQRMPHLQVWVLDQPLWVKTESSNGLAATIHGIVLIASRRIFTVGSLMQYPKDPGVALHWDGLELSEEPVKLTSLFARIWALLEFRNQPLVKVVEEVLPRHIRRRAEREKKRLPKVHTIYLRRIRAKHEHEKEMGEHVKREYNWQWLVGGHWRNQWYRSEGRHKPVYIAPYYKGPEDKPLKAPGAKIFKVVR